MASASRRSSTSGSRRYIDFTHLGRPTAAGPAVSRLIKACLSTEEDGETVDLTRRLRPARARGYLTRGELEAVCFWKSARAIHHIRSNSPSRIRTATRRALTATSERLRLEELIALRGVSVPMASSILMLIDPRRYGVIDIRAWQLLHAAGAVTEKPSGVGFRFTHWDQFLTILRYFAKQFNVKARDIERALFCAHRKSQKGRLYGAGRMRLAEGPGNRAQPGPNRPSGRF